MGYETPHRAPATPRWQRPEFRQSSGHLPGARDSHNYVSKPSARIEVFIVGYETPLKAGITSRSTRREFRHGSSPPTHSRHTFWPRAFDGMTSPRTWSSRCQVPRQQFDQVLKDSLGVTPSSLSSHIVPTPVAELQQTAVAPAQARHRTGSVLPYLRGRRWIQPQRPAGPDPGLQKRSNTWRRSTRRRRPSCWRR